MHRHEVEAADEGGCGFHEQAVDGVVGVRGVPNEVVARGFGGLEGGGEGADDEGVEDAEVDVAGGGADYHYGDGVVVFGVEGAKEGVEGGAGAENVFSA